MLCCIEHGAHACVCVVQELVEEGKYVQTDEGWARADVDDDEIAAANEVARYYRYFHNQPENADQEQMANAEEMLRYLTYGAGWQGLDGPPDAGSRPFEPWDGVGPHWRGDARRGEEERGDSGAAPLAAEEGAGRGGEGAEGSDGEVPEVEGVVDDEGPKAKRTQPQTVDDIAAMTKEEALNSVQAVGDGDDFSDDVKFPPVAMERLGVELAPGQGRRNGLVEEPWRQVIDVALEDDRAGPEDVEEVRAQGVQLAEALRRMRAARDAADAAGEELTAEAVGEVEDEDEGEEEAKEREALREEFAASVGGDIDRVPWTTPYDDVRRPPAPAALVVCQLRTYRGMRVCPLRRAGSAHSRTARQISRSWCSSGFPVYALHPAASFLHPHACVPPRPVPRAAARPAQPPRLPPASSIYCV